MPITHTQEALSRVRELATEPVAQRLARTLLRLAQQIGRREPGGSVLIERITQQELAEISGTSVYTASRTLAEWQERKIVETGRQQLRICNSEGLAGIAAGS
jgi:CRP/FNR family transcriptional regulator, nitrogen oxide reductase regulator